MAGRAAAEALMPLPIEDIEAVLNEGGLLTFDSRIGRVMPGNGGVAISQLGISNYYKMAVLEPNRADKKLRLTSVLESDLSANCVNIVFDDNHATLGAIAAPGYLFSANFSGCVFYLYRDPFGFLHGAHAATHSGREFSPAEYFKARGCKLLWRYETKGLVDENPGCFGAVLVCADTTSITGFVLATKSSMEGLQVKKVVYTRLIDNWPRHAEVM
jgi:hypothetical protein